jgi:hypothetical protein
LNFGLRENIELLLSVSSVCGKVFAEITLVGERGDNVALSKENGTFPICKAPRCVVLRLLLLDNKDFLSLLFEFKSKLNFTSFRVLNFCFLSALDDRIPLGTTVMSSFCNFGGSNMGFEITFLELFLFFQDFPN